MLLLRLYDRLIVALAVVAGVSYLLITFAIVVDVLMRNAGMRPFQAVSALVEYVLLFATMAAAPWLLRKGGHVAIQSLVETFPGGVRRGLARGLMLATVVMFAFLAWRAVLGAMDEIRFGGVDMRSINIPAWVSYALLASGFALLAAETLRLLLRGATRLGSTQSH